MLLLLVPICALALVGDLLLTQYPDVQWHLPLPILVYYTPLSRAASLGILSFVSALVSTLALRARHPQARLVPLCAVFFVTAFVLGQFFSARPLDASTLTRKEKDGVVLQTSGATCVAATCANILRGYGVTRSEAQMAEWLGTTIGGTSTAQLVYGMERLGFTCTLRDVPGINDVHAPAVLLVSGADTHAVAFVGMQGPDAVVLDPMRGRVVMPVRILKGWWLGHAVEISRPTRE